MKIPCILRERSWIQRYTLTRMVGLSTWILQNLENVDFFIKKREYFSLNRNILKSQKNGLQAISLIFELVSPSIEVFWMLLIYWMLNVSIFILLYTTKNMLLGGDLRNIRILYFTEADVEHLQKCKLNSAIPPPLFPCR